MFDVLLILKTNNNNNDNQNENINSLISRREADGNGRLAWVAALTTPHPSTLGVGASPVGLSSLNK